MRIAIGTMFILASVICLGQNSRPPLAPSAGFTSNKPSSSPTSSGGVEYLIGNDDQLDIIVFEVQELNSQPRVSASGTISMTLVGSIQAGGLTTQQLERAIEKVFIDKALINEPHVTVSVREYASQPVSIMGAVKTPDIYQIKGSKTLAGMIAMAQGLDADKVGSTIQVIRAPNPSTPEQEVITISVEDFQRGNASLNLPIYANDTINVQMASSVFVMGEVLQPGEYVLRYGKNISVLNAISMSRGTTKEAKKKEAMIIRVHEDRTREEIQVDIDKITQGKAVDVELMPNDILVVPANRFRAALNRTIESTVMVVSGRLIYR